MKIDIFIIGVNYIENTRIFNFVMFKEDSNLLECDVVSVGEWFLMLQRSVRPSFSRIKLSRRIAVFLGLLTLKTKAS
jgi:hypothetical protein